MLTIGELARLAGTSVRAVRHYHAVGLLPEPERDHSGYRRYAAADLVRLLRVRRLRELGLALDRIAALLSGPEAELADELDALDAELAAQAERIAAQRARLAQLRASNPRPDLPERLGRLFAEAAADGLPARALAQEQEVLLLQLALHPERADALVAEWEQLYTRLRSRPDQREIAVRFDALADADPDDPAVEELARHLAAALAVDLVPAGDGPVPRLTEIVFRDWGEALPPAQRRLVERLAELVG